LALNIIVRIEPCSDETLQASEVDSADIAAGGHPWANTQMAL
jgi:hypothetical protein